MAYSYNTTTKKVTVTAASTARALHNDIQTTFAGSTYMQYAIPDSGAIKDGLYVFQNGWTFVDSTTVGYMTTGSWKDAAGDNLWANIKTVSGDTFTGIQTYYNQTGTPTNFAATGLVNMILPVRTSGTDVASKAVSVYSRPFGYTYSSFTTSATSDGLIDSFPLSVAADPQITLSQATVDAYTDLTITWGAVSKDAGDGAGAQPYAVSIVTTNASRRISEIYQWIQSQLTKATDIDSGAGTHLGKLTAPLVSYTGNMVTMTGVWVEGFSSLDVNNITYTDNNAVTHEAPLSVPVVVNIDAAVVGAQVSVFALDTTGLTDATYTPSNISSTIINATSVSSAVSTSITYTVDIPVRVVVRFAGYQQFSLYTTITSTGLNATAITAVDGAY